MECAIVFKSPLEQGTLSEIKFDDYLGTWFEAFLVDRKAQGFSEGTLHFYRVKLKKFSAYCDSQMVTHVHQITPNYLREYLLWLEHNGHNEGGRHAHYRALRAFLRWYEDETEPDDWRNPIKKVKAPKVSKEPLNPVEFDTVDKLMDTCVPGTFVGDRDAAILLVLLYTGLRASELLAVNLDEVNQARGEIFIRKGKGAKPRTVYLGKKSRKALRRYLKHRRDKCRSLWVTHPRYGSERLTYSGLRSMLNRRAGLAGVEPPTAHDFRRAFAVAMLRNGVDLYTLATLMGHADIASLQPYLKLVASDAEAAHRRASPVDRGRL